MWLTNSSIGRKLIMSISGAGLILFITFHVLMNAVAIFWPVAYNQVCTFLGANWYALVGSAGLAFLFLVHIIYAFWLTFQNRKARGNDRYAVTARPATVEWSSNNMLILGFFIIAFLILHLSQFWYKMQFQEIISHNPADWYSVNGEIIPPNVGTLFIQLAFQHWWTPVVYIIGFIALWFHMNHGFWSMFQTSGLDNSTWLPRLKKISCAWTTIVIALFVIEVLTFSYQAHKKTYYTDVNLRQQYTEYWQKYTVEMSNDAIKDLEPIDKDNQPALYEKKFDEVDQDFKDKIHNLSKTLKEQCQRWWYNQLDQEFGLSQTDKQTDEDYDALFDYEEEADLVFETELEPDTTTIQ